MSLEREMIDACCDPSCYHMQRNKAFREAINACISEHLDDPQDEADKAYDIAIRHCVAAIEQLMKHQVGALAPQAGLPKDGA